MRVQIVQVPYDSGNRLQRMGKGPDHLIQHQAHLGLVQRGHEIGILRIESDGEFTTEIGTSFELNRKISTSVRTARTDGGWPLILAGNCFTAVGTLSGIDVRPLGIVWFDAHGEFNTPETTLSGFLDGMGLAVATGRCFKNLVKTIPGFKALPGKDIVLVGTRDLDPPERRLLEKSAITVVWAEQIRSAGIRSSLLPALSALRSITESIYLHIDLDSLDPEVCISNSLVPPGGMYLEQLQEAIRMVGERFVLVAATISAYDPSLDSDGRARQAASALMETIVSTVEGQTTIL